MILEICKVVREEYGGSISKMIDSAKVEIDNQANAAIIEVKNQVGAMALEIAEKVLRKELQGDAAQEGFVNQLVSDIKLN